MRAVYAQCSYHLVYYICADSGRVWVRVRSMPADTESRPNLLPADSFSKIMKCPPIPGPLLLLIAASASAPFAHAHATQRTHGGAPLVSSHVYILRTCSAVNHYHRWLLTSSQRAHRPRVSEYTLRVQYEDPGYASPGWLALRCSSTGVKHGAGHSSCSETRALPGGQCIRIGVSPSARNDHDDAIIS